LQVSDQQFEQELSRKVVKDFGRRESDIGILKPQPLNPFRSGLYNMYLAEEPLIALAAELI